MKRKRIVDEELLETVRLLPCAACASLDPDGARDAMCSGERISHPHHVKSRGAGGDDIAENLMPLCIRHHTMIHQIGAARMAEKFPVVKQWLKLAGH